MFIKAKSILFLKKLQNGTDGVNDIKAFYDSVNAYKIGEFENKGCLLTTPTMSLQTTKTS
jgi:hypothetical protein